MDLEPKEQHDSDFSGFSLCLLDLSPGVEEVGYEGKPTVAHKKLSPYNEGAI